MSSHAIARSEDARTRQRVLGAVLDLGPVSASGVAKVMDLTAAAIRRHFDALETDGLIEVRRLAGTRAGRGRPARQYVVTAQGHELISHTYDGLAVDVLGFVERRSGREAVAEFAAEHVAELGQRLRARTERPGPTVVGRARQLAAALSAEGFAASASPVAVGTPLEAIQLCQGHCPIQHVAKEYPEFCEAEREAVARIVDTHVQPLALISDGDGICTTNIPLAAARTRTRPAGTATKGAADHD